MNDPDTQRRLDKLDRLEQANRTRVQKFAERAKEQGKKQISAFISGAAHDAMCRIRDKSIQAGEPVSFGQIIERSIPFYEDSIKRTNDTMDININDGIKQAEPTDKPVIETQQELPGPKPRRGTKNYLIWIHAETKRLNGGGMGWAAIADKFNTDGTKPPKKDTWTSGQHLRSTYKYLEKTLAEK